MHALFSPTYVLVSPYGHFSLFARSATLGSQSQICYFFCDCCCMCIFRFSPCFESPDCLLLHSRQSRAGPYLPERWPPREP